MSNPVQRWMAELGPHTVKAAAFHAVFVAAVTVLKSATSAMYLAHQDADGLPYLYVCVSVLMAITTLLFAGPLAGLAPRYLLVRAAWLFFGLTTVGVFAYMAGLRFALASLYVTAELFGTCMSILFWSTVSTWFDARSARRVFGLLSAGGMAGALIGGGGMRLFVGVLGSGFSSVLVTLVTALSVGLLDARMGAIPVKGPSKSVFAGARYLLGRPYPKMVALLAATFSGLGACVDFVFRQEASNRLSELELAALFGDLNAVVGAAAIIWQVVFTSRVLERGGVFVFLSIIPTILALLGASATFFHAFDLLVVMKAVEMAGSFSILQSGVQLLYNPVPVEFRASVRAFIDGMVKKSGMAVAGVILAIAVTWVPPVASPWSVVALAVACVLIIGRLRNAYLDALEEKLRGGRLQVMTSVDVVDRATREALLKTLHSDTGPEVLAALSILKRDSQFRPGSHLTNLLTHDDEAVRIAGMELIPQNASADVAFTLASILSLDARRPRAAAVRALARAFPERAPEMLATYLTDPDPGVGCAVIGALLVHPGSRERALQRLQSLTDGLATATPGEKRELARVLGELDEPFAHQKLQGLLDDPDDGVRALALIGMGKLFGRAVARGSVSDVMSAVPAVESRLAIRADRVRARAALAMLGDAVVPLLRENLDDRTLALSVRVEIPRLLRIVGTADAAQALLFSNIKDHPSLRYRIADALCDLHRARPDIPLDGDRIREAVSRRLDAFEHYRPLCHALKTADNSAPRGGPARQSWDLLRRAATDRLLQNLEMALRLLGLLHGAERMMRAAEQLLSVERRSLREDTQQSLQAARADALEVLDVALQADPLHGRVMSLLEPLGAQIGSTNVTFRTVAHTARSLRAVADPVISVFAERVLRSGVLAEDEHSGRQRMPLKSEPALAVITDPTDLPEGQTMDETTLNRIMALEKVDLFEGLAVDDLAAIASIAQERHAAPGEVLYTQGEPGDSLMVIVSGGVTLLHKSRVVMQHGPGESIGQVSFLDRGPRPTTAVVHPEGVGADLLCIRNDVFMDLVMDRPELNRGLFVVLARRLRALLDLTRE